MLNAFLIAIYLPRKEADHKPHPQDPALNPLQAVAVRSDAGKHSMDFFWGGVSHPVAVQELVGKLAEISSSASAIIFMGSPSPSAFHLQGELRLLATEQGEAEHQVGVVGMRNPITPQEERCILAGATKLDLTIPEVPPILLHIRGQNRLRPWEFCLGKRS